MDEQALNPVALPLQNLSLRDIHLPEPISWWPPAPGWWILLASILLVMLVIFITNRILKKTYLSRQLKRDIKAELEHIKQQFHASQNEYALAKSLSALLRRAGISYYPAKDIAGLTGKNWLAWLDTNNTRKNNKTFQSDIGKVLLTAPYIADKNVTGKSSLDYDAVVAHGGAVMSRKDGISQGAMDGGAIYGPKDGVVAHGCAVYGPKDGQELIELCESWLHSPHNKTAVPDTQSS